jgi:hypothetical protein
MAMFQAPGALTKELGRSPTTAEELESVEKRVGGDSGEAAD